MVRPRIELITSASRRVTISIHFVGILSYGQFSGCTLYSAKINCKTDLKMARIAANSPRCYLLYCSVVSFDRTNAYFSFLFSSIYRGGDYSWSRRYLVQHQHGIKVMINPTQQFTVTTLLYNAVAS